MLKALSHDILSEAVFRIKSFESPKAMSCWEQVSSSLLW